MAEESKGAIWDDPAVRLILDGMSEPFVALDGQGRIVFANHAVAALCEGDDLLGRRARAVWPLMAGSEADAAFDRAFATGIPVRFDQQIESSGRWVEFNAYRSGEHLLINAHDITEIKATARREEALRAIVDALPHVAWYALPDGRVMINDRWRSYTGSQGSDLEDFWARLHPEDIPIAERALAGRASGEPYEYDIRIRNADGAYRWNHVRSSPYRSAPGEPLSWIGTTTDVHDERMREKTLRLLLGITERTRLLEDPAEVLRIALQAMGEAFGLSRSAYAEVSEDGHSFTRLQQWPTRVDPISGRMDELGQSFVEDQRAGRVTVVADVRTRFEEGVAARYAARGTAAFVSVPLVKRGRLVAALSAHFAVPHDWTEDEVEAVGLVADRCWTEVERARAQRGALEREARLRALVEANPVGVVVVDIDTGFALEANDAWLSALGRTREELEGGLIDIRAMSGEEGSAITDARIAQARQGGSAGFYEKTYTKPDGTQVPVLVGFTPLDPEVRRATAFMLDLTDLRRAEKAVAEGERRWRLLAETIPAIVFSLGREGQVEYINSRGRAFFGKEPGEEALGALAPLITAGAPFQIERPLLDAKRQYRWHLCRTEPMLDESGGIVRWIGALTDIHEAKSRERALRFLVDLDDAITNLDEPAQAMRETAFMLAGAVGTDRCAYAEIDGDEFTILGDYARNGPSVAGHWPLNAFGEEFPAILRDGKTFVADDIVMSALPPDERDAYRSISVVAAVCAPIVRAGRLVAMMLVDQSRPRKWTREEIDLVEQVAERSWANIERVRSRRELRKSEERLREANEGLEQKVRERTKELEDANEALQGFGYHVSHDLRTPLRAIVSTSRLLQMDYREQLPEEANTLLSRQAAAAQKLGKLIDDLLQLSRLSQAELEKTRVDLTSLGRDAADEALYAHPGTRVRIEVEEGLTVQADPRFLRLALVNLLENAVKYSPQGGTVRLRRRPNGDFAISDEGIGIEPPYLELIFEAFKRLHRDDEFEGTGIGLANVRRVLTRHGGKVWAESEIGKGSTFVMRM